MKLFLILIVTGLSVSWGNGFNSTTKGECDSIEAKAVVVNPQPGKENGEIMIEAKGGKGSLHYFFFDKLGRPINSGKEKQNSIKNLDRGVYKCSVADENGCIKLLEIELTNE